MFIGTLLVASLIAISPASLHWGKVEGGTMAAALEGAENKPGPYTVRFKYVGFGEIKPHYHSKVQHILVLSGTFYYGIGDTFDRRRMHALKAGSLLAIPPGVVHYTMAEPGTIIDEYGCGPQKSIDLNGKEI
jgi:quercetin dioxygenase-like cupin family protein